MKKNSLVSVFTGMILSIVLFPFALKAQEFSKSYHVAAEYNYLYSTHSTKFRGPSLLVDKDLNRHWAVGLGIGYNTCAFHPDNGYDLKNLKLIPVFASAQYTFSRNKIFDPYALLKTGVTFMNYEQKWETSTESYNKINSTGWYTYAGAGTNLNLSKQFQVYLNIGLIGYKMSFNALDINPHGVAGNIGLRVKI